MMMKHVFSFVLLGLGAAALGGCPIYSDNERSNRVCVGSDCYSCPDPYVSDMLMQAVRAGDALLLGKALHNDLQPAALSLRPMLRQGRGGRRCGRRFTAIVDVTSWVDRGLAPRGLRLQAPDGRERE